MAIIYDRQLASVAGRRRRKTPAACCDSCEGLGELAALAGHRGRALRKLGRAHIAGELAGLGDLDTSAWVVDRSVIDAESNAFDGRLNAWLLEYAKAAARLPASYVQQVDDFVFRWRKIRSDFWFIGANYLKAVVGAEAEFNRLRDQFVGYGQQTAIAPATVRAGGLTVRADQIPPGLDWFDQVKTVAKWGGVIVGGVALLKISSDLGVFRRLGGLIKQRAPAPP